MQRIGVRELRQHASRYLELVKAGETVEVTERGQLVAVLAPPGQSATARDRLVVSGRLLPASGPFLVPDRSRRRKSALSTAAVLEELREELDR